MLIHPEARIRQHLSQKRRHYIRSPEGLRNARAVRLRTPEATDRGRAGRRHACSNSWAEFAGLFRDTHQAHANHERAKNELEGLMPEDAKEAMGHGLRAKRSKSGAVSFDLVEMEVSHASLQ
jgi:hypothetical protein